MTGTPRWIRVTEQENIPVREGRAVAIEGREIAVFNLGGRFLAVENRCPHRGGPLSDGIVSGNSVVCPLHAWKVCLEGGKVLQPMDGKDRGACVASYPVRVEGGAVCIQYPAAGPDFAEVLPSAMEMAISRRIADAVTAPYE